MDDGLAELHAKSSPHARGLAEAQAPSRLAALVLPALSMTREY